MEHQLKAIQRHHNNLKPNMFTKGSIYMIKYFLVIFFSLLSLSNTLLKILEVTNVRIKKRSNSPRPTLSEQPISSSQVLAPDPSRSCPGLAQVNMHNHPSPTTSPLFSFSLHVFFSTYYAFISYIFLGIDNFTYSTHNFMSNTHEHFARQTPFSITNTL